VLVWQRYGSLTEQPLPSSQRTLFSVRRQYFIDIVVSRHCCLKTLISARIPNGFDFRKLFVKMQLQKYRHRASEIILTHCEGFRKKSHFLLSDLTKNFIFFNFRKGTQKKTKNTYLRGFFRHKSVAFL
jgi:hypothetical protein